MRLDEIIELLGVAEEADSTEDLKHPVVMVSEMGKAQQRCP